MRQKRIAIVEISGGLGNQLFQLSAAKYLSNFYEVVELDYYPNLINPKRKTEIYELAALLGFQERGTSKTLMRFLAKFRLLGLFSVLKGEVLVSEGSPFSPPPILDKAKKVRYRGYWQSIVCAREIRDDFSAWLDLRQQNEFAVHLRRGDYQNTKNQAFHGLLSQSYFDQIFSTIKHGSRVTIFSDSLLDQFWLQEKGKHFEIQISSEIDPIETLRNLASHSSIAISNSTFSWWAAYISGAKRIIMPSDWMPNTKTPDALVLPGSEFITSKFD